MIQYPLAVFVFLAIGLQNGVVDAVPVWGQCGGVGYSGSTNCDSGTTCVKLNDWYYQCQPGSNPSPTTSVSTTGSPNPTNVPPGQSITVDFNTQYQQMDGFGCSQAFGRADNIYSSNAAAQKAALDLLFSQTEGGGFSILRNRIGNGNTPADSILPTSPGSPGATPNYQWDGFDSAQLWLSKKAKDDYDVPYIYANAWGAPPFMKTNNAVGNGGYLCGVSGASCSTGDWKQAYANFLLKYVDYYAQEGITINYLGFLNEPDFQASYASMLSSGTQAADFLKVLYPAVQKAGLADQLNVTCCDSMGWQNQRQMTSQIQSSGAESQVDIITSHSYSTSPDNALSTSRRVWQTEYADLNGSWTTAWYSNGGIGDGFYWAKLIYNGIVNARLSAYLYWEGAETEVRTNSCLISIEGSTAVGCGRLWALAQWSRYVRPGAIRLGTSSASSSLLTSAFKNTDGSVSVQVINNGGSSQGVSISFSGSGAGAFQSVAAWLSSSSNGDGKPEKMSADLTDAGVVGATVPRYSMTTFKLT